METEKKEKELSQMSENELREVINEQMLELRRLRAYVEQSSRGMMFKRLDYLFKILDSSAVFDDDIIDIASNEIEEIMWPSDEGEVVDKEGSNEVGEDG